MTGSSPGRDRPAATAAGRVDEAARAGVLGAVAELACQPHQDARSLESRRILQIAYVMPQVQLQPGNLIMQQFLRSLAAASASRGCGMVLVGPGADPRDDLRRLIASRTVDGFVLSEIQPDDPRVALLAEARVPFACFGRTGEGQPPAWVDIDNHGATVETVEHVLARGYTRLAYVGYRSASSWDTDRAAGFLAGVERHGRRAREAGLLLVDEATALRKVRSLIAGVRPDAVVTGSDRLAAVVYGVAAELRLRVGRDLAVTGFDGSVAADLLHPRLTSVAIPVGEIAVRVLDRALWQLDHGPDQRPGEILPARLRLGGSTAPAGRSDSAPGAPR